MKKIVLAALASTISFGLVGISPTLADGVSNGASIKVVGPQLTREATTQTSRQITTATSKATRESTSR